MHEVGIDAVVAGEKDDVDQTKGLAILSISAGLHGEKSFRRFVLLQGERPVGENPLKASCGDSGGSSPQTGYIRCQVVQGVHIRALLADDQEMVRQALRRALQDYPNIEVVGEASNGEEAVTAASKLLPSVIVMDISMSKMDGITATRLIKTQHPRIAVVGLSVHRELHQIEAMQKAGAYEVLPKDSAVTVLYSAIQRAIASIQPILITGDTAVAA